MKHQGFLTCVAEATLPYPSMDTRLLLGIEEGIRAAWKNLIGNTTKRATMLNCDEVDINVYLELELDNTLAKAACPTFTDSHFIAPRRGAEYVNFNGEKREKRPDIVFYLKDRRPGIDIGTYDAVFAECKIVDSNSNKDLGLYVKKGLNKFVNGDYAWAMSHALMIGYVRTSQSLPESLTDYFNNKKTAGKYNRDIYNLQGDPKMCRHSNAREIYRVCHTVHSRLWGYPPDSKRKPGNIVVRHLWLELKLEDK